MIFKAYIDMFKNYANFKGCTNRRYFWSAFIINIVLAVILKLILDTDPGTVIEIICFLFVFGIVVPHFALIVRRIRDTGRSPYCFFYFFIPIAGFIMVFWILLQPSVEGQQFKSPGNRLRK